MRVPRVLIIAGSDSGGGAGIQADIKTVTMLGGHAMTAITAITAQNTLGVDAVVPVPTDMVMAQIEAVVRDIGVDAVKIGMIGSAETAEAVAGRLEALAVPVVFDPVMVATSGAALADDATIVAFERLMALASVVTPNVPELEALSGSAVVDEESLQAAAEAVMKRTGCPAVLAKGGHLPRDFIASPANQIFDALYQLSDEGYWAEHSYWDARIETLHTHGTGCTLASAVAVGLGIGMKLPDAVVEARKFVRSALRAAPGFGGGHGPMGHWLGVNPFEVIRGTKPSSP